MFLNFYIMEGADIGVPLSSEVEETGESGENHKSNLRWATTTLPHPFIRANETWTVLKVLDRVYGQGYRRIGSDWVG